ncbi:MAG: DUF2946 family protein [Planctomycetes bacterium]|nr:DUF2946 family protein [Planctomycetota bacterium]
MRSPLRFLIATLTALVVLLQVLAPGLHRLSHRHDDPHTAAAHAHRGCPCELHKKSCQHDPQKGGAVLMPGEEAVAPCAFCLLLARSQPWVLADPAMSVCPALPPVGTAPMPRAPPLAGPVWTPVRPRAPPIS